MHKDILLKYITPSIVQPQQYYTFQQLPYQISNAIYLYGDSHIFDIIIFIDTSENQDGSQGMIITPDKIYYQFQQAGSFSFSQIQSLSLQKKRYQTIGQIKATQIHRFDNSDFNVDIFINQLSSLLEMDIDLQLDIYEKIAYYTPLILHDIENDEYEDVTLNTTQQKQIQEFYQEIDIISKLDDENYRYELQQLCPKVLHFFEELELDSDEIDELYQALEELENHEENNDDLFKNMKQYYEDMMSHGDSSKWNQINNMMNMLGINPQELQNKSPEEMNNYINDLCDRFHISHQQLDTLIQKLNK